MQRMNYQEYEINRKYNMDEFEQEGERKEVGCFIYGLPDCYKIYKTMYKSKIKHNTWSIMKIEIYKDNEPYIEFYRNYPSISIAFAEQNSKEFIITSEDYQCITIINLTDKVIKTYTDVDDIQMGCGFCPVDIDWDEYTLYIEGCIWGCPYETMICRDIDLQNPIDAFNNAEWDTEYDDDIYTDPDDEEDED